LKEATSEKTVGVLLEAVQGEGGIWPGTPEFIQGVRAWCDERNLVMICDEVQAGMGRTGKFFSWEHYGIVPDIVTMAKGLAGGVPIGAMLTGQRTDLFVPGDHGTTFGGNPIASAAGITTIKTILDEHLLENAAKMGAYCRSKFEALCEKYDFIDSPRGKGLMQAVNVKHDLAPAIVQQALEPDGPQHGGDAHRSRSPPRLIAKNGHFETLGRSPTPKMQGPCRPFRYPRGQ